MSSPGQTAPLKGEAEFFDSLRSRYEAEGFTFTVSPDPKKLPRFFGTYVPDALAQKPGLNVAIEVKSSPSQSTSIQLREIRRLFDGHNDWQFNAVFSGSSSIQSVEIPVASPEAIRDRMEEVRALSIQGNQRPAFIMAWSLLEAALNSVEKDLGNNPRTPGTVVQTLAMDGYISPDMERLMRGLIKLRNRIVHGDITAEAAASQVNSVLDAVEETLTANAA